MYFFNLLSFCNTKFFQYQIRQGPPVVVRQLSGRCQAVVRQVSGRCQAAMVLKGFSVLFLHFSDILLNLKWKSYCKDVLRVRRDVRKTFKDQNCLKQLPIGQKLSFKSALYFWKLNRILSSHVEDTYLFFNVSGETEVILSYSTVWHVKFEKFRPKGTLMASFLIYF